MADYYDQLDYIRGKIHFSVDMGEREHWIRQYRFLDDHLSKVRSAKDIVRSWDYSNNVVSVGGGSGLGTSSTVKKSDPNKNHNKKLLAARRMINGTGVKTA